jgi:hypothetical protein
MSLKYHGSEGLIVVAKSFSEFPSGLNRADITYVCRTTKISLFTASLGAKKPLPNFATYTSQFAATREDRSDGFSYFSATGFKSNSAASSVVLGALVSSLSLPVQSIVNSSTSQGIVDYSVPLTIISDVVTKSYTILTSSSNTLITATPPSTLSLRIINAPVLLTAAIKISAVQTYTLAGIIKNQQYVVGNDLKTYVGSKIDIISVDRQNYGTIDEVTITWGYSFNFSNPLQLFKLI